MQKTNLDKFFQIDYNPIVQSRKEELNLKILDTYTGTHKTSKSEKFYTSNTIYKIPKNKKELNRISVISTGKKFNLLPFKYQKTVLKAISFCLTEKVNHSVFSEFNAISSSYIRNGLGNLSSGTKTSNIKKKIFEYFFEEIYTGSSYKKVCSAYERKKNLDYFFIKEDDFTGLIDTIYKNLNSEKKIKESVKTIIESKVNISGNNTPEKDVSKLIKEMLGETNPLDELNPLDKLGYVALYFTDNEVQKFSNDIQSILFEADIYYFTENKKEYRFHYTKQTYGRLNYVFNYLKKNLRKEITKDWVSIDIESSAQQFCFLTADNIANKNFLKNKIVKDYIYNYQGTKEEAIKSAKTKLSKYKKSFPDLELYSHPKYKKEIREVSDNAINSLLEIHEGTTLKNPTKDIINRCTNGGRIYSYLKENGIKPNNFMKLIHAIEETSYAFKNTERVIKDTKEAINYISKNLDLDFLPKKAKLSYIYHSKETTFTSRLVYFFNKLGISAFSVYDGIYVEPKGTKYIKEALEYANIPFISTYNKKVQVSIDNMKESISLEYEDFYFKSVKNLSKKLTKDSFPEGYKFKQNYIFKEKKTKEKKTKEKKTKETKIVSEVNLKKKISENKPELFKYYILYTISCTVFVPANSKHKNKSKNFMNLSPP